MNERQVTTHVTGIDDLTDSIVIVSDNPDPSAGNGTHFYEASGPDGKMCASIQFQHGPRNDPSSTPGLTLQAAIEILIDHVRSFQGGPYACRENALVLTKLEEAQHWAQHRAIDRKRRGVLGVNAK
jgi:hypothetical protein